MILAFDTYYFDNLARTVCVAFEEWSSENPTAVFTEIKECNQDYVPGEFYKRELPCILSLLKKIPEENIEAIIVDGFVVLNDEGKPGLGGYLFKELQSCIPVIGVAKRNFFELNEPKREIFRGGSHQPLYITALGIGLDSAAERIKQMQGEFRIPTLLKKLDRLTKENGS